MHLPVYNLSVLYVVTPHLREVASVCTVSGQKLGHNCHRLQRVDRVLFSSPVEVFHAHAVGVDITSVLIADSIVTIAACIVTALNWIRAAVELFRRASVWGERAGHRIGWE